MSQQSSIHILVCDDHSLVRKSLIALLEQDKNLVVVGEAESGQEAVELALQLSPDIVLMDINMPYLNGIEATRRICQSSRKSKVIILTTYLNNEYVVQAIHAGASGYLSKNELSKNLFEAIYEVQKGKIYFGKQILTAELSQYSEHSVRSKKIDMPINPLTSREREILQLIAEGNHTKEIALRISISAKTVENHRKNIMRKLNIHNQAHLVIYAFKNGILIS